MFDEKEIFDIVISTIVLSFAFYFYLHNFSFIAVLLIVFTSFVLHELGHKFVAILFGCESRYEISYPLLITSFIIAYLSNWKIIFAAPGAVVSYKSGMSEREEGLISLAGPMMNVLVAIICLYLMYHTSYLSFLQTLGLFNCFVAFFNMLPFSVLDGKKVYDWNKNVWILTMVIIILVAINFPIFKH